MTLKRRIERLEQVRPAFYADVSEIPTPVLEAMLKRAIKAGEWPAPLGVKDRHRRLEGMQEFLAMMVPRSKAR